jgi:hypothetical protein
MQIKGNEKIAMETHRMNGKKQKHDTHLGKEFLDVAVGRRGTLGAHEILYELPHVHILNQKKR